MYFDHLPHFQLYIFPVGPLQTNCYFLIDKNSRQALMIDPGDEGDFLSEQVLELNLQLRALYFTHGHCDHVLGALPLFLNFSQPDQPLPVFLDPLDKSLYQQARQTAQHFSSTPVDPIIPVKQLAPPTLNFFQEIFPASPAKILSTPGHTPGSLTLYFPADKVAFVGDLIFADGSVGRTDTAAGDAKKLHLSLALLQKKLHPDTLICPGHAGPFTLSTVL